MASSSAPSTSTSKDLTCVVGTLPPSLTAAISQATGSVVVYFSTELPLPAPPTGAISPTSGNAQSFAASPDDGVAKYAVFEDTATYRRWTVELSCNNDSDSHSVSEASDIWSVDEATLKDLQLLKQTTIRTASTRASTQVALTGPRYVMMQDTWKESAPCSSLSPPPVVSKAVTSTAAAVKSTATSDGQLNQSRAVRMETEATQDTGLAIDTLVPLPHLLPCATENGVNTTGDKANTTSAAGSAAPSAEDPSALAEPPTPAASNTSPFPITAATQLKGLSLHSLTNQHSALVRLLVQLLAPRRMTVQQVMKELCTVSCGTSKMVCAVQDTSSSGLLYYTEADIATAVGRLTTSHPSQPKFRELKSEAYFLMRVDGFTDGTLRRQAVNRAYPALAHHWPASAALLDAMERYADREVVLETRKRHPELMMQEGSGKQRKRQRSNSSSSTSRGASDDEEKRGPDLASNAVPPSAVSAGEAFQPTHKQSQQAQQIAQSHSSLTRHVFRSLREYPQSLERGDLHAWSSTAEAAQVRECLQAATTLTQLPSVTSSRGRATAIDTSTTVLSVMPITTKEDKVMLGRHYDALSAAETTLERRLLDYRDAMQELKAWYREEHCAPQFKLELRDWLQTQEKSYVTLTSLRKDLHENRYRLARDLNDYVNLHVLGVV